MLGLPIFPTPTAVSVQLLNRLLRHQPWALQHLIVHSGKSIALKIGPANLYVYILDNGYIQAYNPNNDFNHTPNVTLILPNENLGDVLTALRNKNQAEISNLMQIQGDAGLAQVISDLARDLRWDIEHSLASRIGDIPALGIINTFKFGAKTINNTNSRLVANLSEYLGEESGLIANTQELHDFSQQLNNLMSKIEQLELELNKLFGKQNV